MCRCVGGDQTAAAHIIRIERMSRDQFLDVVEGRLRVLENTLSPSRCMRLEGTGDNELLPPGHHPAAARAGTDTEFARVKHHDAQSRGRELDGR